MTTTTSFFSKSFFALTKDSLRRNLGSMIYLFVVTFFFFPVQYMLEIFGPNWVRQQNLIDQVGDLYTPAHIYTALSVVIMTMVLITAPMVAAVTQMSYMHSRRSVDLYHSLPLTRGQMICAGGLTAFLTTAIPMAVNYLIIFGAGLLRRMTLPSGMAFTFLPGQIAMDALGWAVTQLAVIAMIMLVASQVGSIFENFVFSLELLAAPFMVVVIVHGLCSAFLLGYTGGPTFQELSRLSPLVLMVERFTITSDSKSAAADLLMSNLMMLCWFVLGTLVALLALRLYKKRKSEMAESSGMAGPLGFAAKAVIVFVGASAMGTIFYLMRNGSKTVFVIWAVIGGALTFLLMEAVFNRGFRGLKKSFPSGIAMVSGVLVLAMILVTGGAGYENRIPAANKIQSVSIDTRGRFGYTIVLNAENFHTYYTYTGQGERQFVYNYYSENTVTLTDPACIELVRKIHEETIKWNKGGQRANELIASQAARPSYQSRVRSIQYVLASGSLQRLYNNWSMSEETSDLLWQLEAQPEFVRKTCPVFFTRAEDYKSLQIKDRTGLLAGSPTRDSAAAGRILEALQADILGDDIAAIQNNTAKTIGYITLDSGVDADSIYSMTRPLEKNTICSYSVRIYEGYTNTLKVLRELGLDGPLTEETPEIAGFLASDYGSMNKYDWEQSGHAITDPAQVAELFSLIEEVPLLPNDNYGQSYRPSYLYLAPVDAQGNVGVTFAISYSRAPDYLLRLFPYTQDTQEKYGYTVAEQSRY